MANYQSLKAAINAVIKANGNKEITGTVLNEVLLAMVNSLGAGYQFAGVATPSTNPGTPDQKVFYIASQAGSYTNFGGAVVSDGIAIFEWNGTWTTETLDLSMAGQVQSDWTETDTTKKSYIKHKPNIPPSANVDPVPTNGSPNAVASGGVYNAIKAITDFLNNGYYFVGIAGTSTVPDSVTQYGIFYIASAGGTYTNFLNGDDEPLTLYQGLNILYKDVEDDGWNYFEVFKFSDFVDTTQQQSLSSQQKALARNNIAAVSYEQQSLDAEQQVQAQNNMMGKAYAPAENSGLGKVYLDKNNGVLTQAMINTANTVYVIQYDYTMSGNITVPAGCTLEFDGGSITANGSADTITGNNTQINAITKIFNGIVLSGSWSNSVFHISWVDSTIYSDVQNIINYCATTSIILNLDGKKIDVSNPYNIDRPFRGSLVEPFDYKYQKKERFFTIYNGIINVTGDNGAFSTTVDFQDNPITSCHIKFEKVKFMSPYSEDGSGNPQTTACVLKDTKLFDLLFEDCTFNFIKLIDNTASSKYIQGLRLINCHITECYANFIETPSTIYYCEIVNSLLEGFVHMLIKGQTLQTVVVDNCCMETIKRLVTFTNHRGISITNNYFESIESTLVQCLDEVALSPNSGFNFTGNGVFYCSGSAVLSLAYELDYNIKANHLINCPQLVTFLNGHSFDQSNIATLRNLTVPATGSVTVFLYDGFYYISRDGQFTSMISITGSELTKWLATGFDERIDLSMSTDNTLEISSKGYGEQTVIIKNLNPQEVNLQL